MRFQSPDKKPWKSSENSDMYVALARWCNQPNMFKKLSFREFCYKNQEAVRDPYNTCSAMRSLIKFEKEEPEFARQYFDLHFNKSNTYSDDIISGVTYTSSYVNFEKFDTIGSKYKKNKLFPNFCKN